jgi:TrpR-related protein YerC/YecD
MKNNKDKKALYQAILSLKNEGEMQKFLRDLLTEAEINEFTNRWKVARMLAEKVSYEVIAAETGMSSTTIARISKWLNTGMGGYKFMVKRMKTAQNKNHHTPLGAV